MYLLLRTDSRADRALQPTRGGIGVQRIFGSGALYHPLLWAMLGGAFIPVPFWWLGRKYPKKFYKAVNWTVILNSITAIPPANGSNYAGFFIAGFVFRKQCAC